MQGLKHYIDFLWAMTEKEIKARYKRAVFGFLWVVLNPVLQMIIIGVIFSFFIKVPNYFLFLLVGLLPWQFFSISLSKATPSIVYERSLLQKAKFPIETIPISLILANFFNMTVSLVILFFLLGFLNKLMFPQILLVVPALIWLLAFTIGLSLLTASLQVRFRDINFFVQTLLILWFYATPVLYTLSLIPKTLYPLFAINPLTSIFEIMHLSLLDQGVVNNQIVFLNLSTSVLVIFVGIFIYKRKNKFFVDWL